MKKPTVLFLCKHNACRSQMAEALLRSMAGDRFDVASAGMIPRTIHPLVETVLTEIGVSMKNQTSKSMDFFLGRGFIEYVIIVCDTIEKDCPTLKPFALSVERWPIPDPAERHTAEDVHGAFRAARDELRRLLTAWLVQHSTDTTKEKKT